MWSKSDPNPPQPTISGNQSPDPHLPQAIAQGFKLALSDVFSEVLFLAIGAGILIVGAGIVATSQGVSGSRSSEPAAIVAASDNSIIRLRKAIIGQESNGRSDVMNASGSGATGLGQVMSENIAAWSQQCIGRSLSQGEFIANPDLQIQVIDCKLTEYWNQVEGDTQTKVRKVAATWYSGQSDLYDNPAPQSWNGNSYPSIRDYTLKVWERWQAIPGSEGSTLVSAHAQPRSASLIDLFQKGLQYLFSAPAESPSSSASGGKTVPFKGIQVTSAKDATGEPGLDYVVSNGDRGAEFGALVAGTVVEVVADQNWESHVDAGDTRRGYGNLVVVRVNESGSEIDMLYAHLDRVDVKEGDRVGVGTVLGTQGRTGSTTGAHVSVDFFAPGTRTANAASLVMRDRIAGILANNPDSLNQQIQATPAPQISAAAATDSDRFTAQIWIQTNSGIAPASGIIIRQDGLILTNRHVIANGFLYVETKDGQQYQGRTIASDANLDLALVQLDGAAGLPTAKLAQSANVKPGDMVKAVGHPMGEAWKHTEAQVLATDSKCGLKVLDRRCIRTPTGFLNPGNSGGSLLNAKGEVIGINRAIQESTGEGVSIPIEVFHQQFKMP